MKTPLYISAIVLGLMSNNAATAQEQERNTVWDGFSGFLSPDWGKDFSATVGVKVWMNEWRRDTFSTDDVFDRDGDRIIVTDSRPRSETSNLEATPIPQLSVRYQWLFVTGSYYSETQFGFDPTQRTRTIITDAGTLTEATDVLIARDQVSADRYEWDIGGGRLHSSIRRGLGRLQENSARCFFYDGK